MKTNDDNDFDVLEFDRRHLTLLSNMRVEWVFVENGAPQLSFVPYIAEEPYPSFESRVIDKVRSCLRESSLSPSDAISIIREAMLALPVLVAFGELEPQVYSYESPVIGEELDCQPFIEQRLVERSEARVTVQVTQGLVDLLKNSYIRFYDDDGAEASSGIDVKRPYGSATFFYLDMAKVLRIQPMGATNTDYPDGREFTEAQIDALDKLHFLTQPTLQVFLKEAAVELGRFKREPAAFGIWTRID